MDHRIDIEVIRELISISRQMEQERLVNAYEGNISVLKDGLIYITPTTTRKSALTEDLIAVIDEDGRQIHGSRKPSSEIIMHRQTYHARPDVHAVIHCHSLYLTAYAMCNQPLEVKSHFEMVMRYRDIPVAPYGRPGTREIIDNALPYLRNRNLILLGNHGVLAVGSTLDRTLERVEAAEKFAEMLTIAQKIGAPTDIPAEDIELLSQYPIEV